MPQLTCPSCKEVNEGDMTFCIFCGSSLKSGKLTGRVPTVAGLTCTSCNKSDVLNATFCVFCGARIMDNQNRTGAVQPLSEAERSSLPRASGGGFPLALGIGLALLIGSAGGAVLGVKMPKPAPALALAKSGLVVQNTAPFADIFITDDGSTDGTGKRSFFLARSGKDGALSFEDLDPGQYLVAVGDGAPMKALVKKGDATVLVAR